MSLVTCFYLCLCICLCICLYICLCHYLYEKEEEKKWGKEGEEQQHSWAERMSVVTCFYSTTVAPTDTFVTPQLFDSPPQSHMLHIQHTHVFTYTPCAKESYILHSTVFQCNERHKLVNFAFCSRYCICSAHIFSGHTASWGGRGWKGVRPSWLGCGKDGSRIWLKATL